MWAQSGESAPYNNGIESGKDDFKASEEDECAQRETTKARIPTFYGPKRNIPHCYVFQL